MNGQVIDKLVVAHELLEPEKLNEGVIVIGISCLLAGFGIGLIITSIITYYKYTNKFISIKKKKRKTLTKYNFHLLKRGVKYKVNFFKPSEQHTDLILRE